MPATAGYTPVNGISNNSYNAVRRRVEKWLEGPWAKPEQMIALGQWLVVEGESRRAGNGD